MASTERKSDFYSKENWLPLRKIIFHAIENWFQLEKKRFPLRGELILTQIESAVHLKENRVLFNEKLASTHKNWHYSKEKFFLSKESWLHLE